MIELHILNAMSDNFMYVIDVGGTACVVDPAEARPVLDFVESRGLRLAMILNTHHHYDHVSGNLAVKEATGCEIVGPDEPRIPGLDRAVGDGDVIEFAHGIQVLATPGHAATDLSFYLPAADGFSPGAVWTGDTMFVGGCGRLFECDASTMWASLCKLAHLPEETRVYCGHEYTVGNFKFAASVEPDNRVVTERLHAVKVIRADGKPTVPSSIGLEKRTNPFLRASDPAMQAALGMSGAEPATVFAELRRRKDSF